MASSAHVLNHESRISGNVGKRGGGGVKNASILRLDDAALIDTDTARDGGGVLVRAGEDESHVDSWRAILTITGGGRVEGDVAADLGGGVLAEPDTEAPRCPAKDGETSRCRDGTSRSIIHHAHGTGRPTARPTDSGGHP